MSNTNKCPLTCEQFTKALLFVKDKVSKTHMLNKTLNSIFPNASHIYPFSEYQTAYLELLKIIMKDTDSDNHCSWIDYFIFGPPNWGDDWYPNLVTIDNNDICLDSIESLYSLLIKLNFN